MYRTLLLVALTAPGMAHADMMWSSVDPSDHAAHETGHGGHGRSGTEMIDLLYGDGATAVMWLPTLEQRTLPLDHGSARIKPSGMDNYHLLYAVRETPAVHETALRYHYLRGKPSGRSPAELVYAEKVPLEIVPAPLPREHGRYQSATRVSFLIRFQGKALADHPVTLETTNGLRTGLVSDARGRITFELPDDFHGVAAGRERNAPAEFFLHTHHSDGRRNFVTSLSAEYHVDPRHWQTQSGAVWSGVAGFMAGLGILGFVARRNAAKG